jgi:hypothetical protein
VPLASELRSLLARALEANTRCPATEVNPSTAKRDLDVLGALRSNFGHLHMGAREVVDGGDVAEGDELRLEAY